MLLPLAVFCLHGDTPVPKSRFSNNLLSCHLTLELPDLHCNIFVGACLHQINMFCQNEQTLLTSQKPLDFSIKDFIHCITQGEK